MAHIKETSVSRTNTLEEWRQKTNKISYDLGSLYELDSNFTDSVQEFTATEGQTNFFLDTLQLAIASEEQVDNIAGSIILLGDATVDAGFTTDERIFQGTAGSETWEATIVAVTDRKIIVENSTGTFSASEDVILTDDNNIVLAAADISSIISESYGVPYCTVYVNDVEQEQGMTTTGFHAPSYDSRIVLAGSPTIPNSFVEGVTIYQGTIGSETWVATILYADDTGIHIKSTSSGTFSPSVMVKVGSGDIDNRILAANLSTMVQIDSEHKYMVELHTPASAGDTVTLKFFNAVLALNELQNDIGVVENLTTTTKNLTGAVNELDAEIGNTTEFATVTDSNNTVSTAIKTLHDEVGDITTLDDLISATTLVGASNELQTDIGDVADLNTTATTVVTAVNEHETDIGNMTFTGLTATNISAAIRELRVDLGDVTASNMGTTATNAVGAIKELEGEIGDITALDTLISATTLVGASNELQTDIGDVSALTTTNKTVVTAINEHEGDIGDMTFTGLTATDLSAAIRELRVDLGDVTAANMGTTATNAVGAILELEKEIDTLNTRVEPTQAFNANFTATTIMDGINELMTDLGDVTAANMGTSASTVVTAISELEGEIDDLNTYTGEGTTLSTAATTLAGAVNEHEGDIGDMTFTGLAATNISAAIRELSTDLGDVTAANMGTTASTVVTAISELETEIDTLNTIVEPTQAFNAWFDVYDEQEEPELIPNTIIAGINKLASEKFDLTSASVQTINSDISLTTSNTLTIPQGATLDVSSGTLLIGGGEGSSLSFDTAFINLNSTSQLEGININRSKIVGIGPGEGNEGEAEGYEPTIDAKIQWNEGLVQTGTGNQSHKAWQIVGFTNDDEPAIFTSSIVTFYNAKDLVSNNTETNITVGWDATDQNFNFVLNDDISIDNITLSGTLETDHVDAVTMTTGTLVTTGDVTVGGNLKVSGSVTTVNTETVTIADNIIVLNSNEDSVPTEDAGIEVERGSSTNVALAWDESEDRWRFTNDGATYYNIPVPDEYDTYSWTIQGSGPATEEIASGATFQIEQGTGITSILDNGTITIENIKPFDGLEMVDGDGTSITLANNDFWIFTEGSGTGASIDINHTNTDGPGYATTFTVTNTDRGSSQAIFKNIAVDDAEQDDIVANSNNDILNIAAGNAMTLTTNAATDTLTIAHSDTSNLLQTAYGGSNDGVVIESMTFDTNGHATAITTVDLDGRYDNYGFWSLFVDSVSKDNVTSGEKVDFKATAPLSVAHSISDGNVLTWTHDASGVTANTYGQSGAEDGQYIKSITVNATGHITAISADDFDDRYDRYVSWTARDHDGTDYTVTSGDILQYKEGDGMDVDFTADDVLTFTNTDRGSSQNIFKNISVDDAEQDDIVADDNNDTLNIEAGDAITLTTNADTDTLTIAHSDTSTQASVNNSNGSVIQDISLDTFGHLTSITSVDLDDRYLELTGGTLTGQVSASDILFADSKRAKFGTNSDFQIYHDGTDTIMEKPAAGDGILKYQASTDGFTPVILEIENTTNSAIASSFIQFKHLRSTSLNSLKVGSIENTFSILNADDSSTQISATAHGAVTLHHDGSTKLATDSGGVNISGDLDVTGDLSVDTNTLFVNHATGRVGIGTVSPTTKLDVVGNAKVSGAINVGSAINETVYILTGTELDPDNGTIQTKTLTANTTFTESLTTGQSMTLAIEDGTDYTVTWPTIIWATDGGDAPALNTTGYTTIQLWKIGTTLYGARVGDA